MKREFLIPIITLLILTTIIILVYNIKEAYYIFITVMCTIGGIRFGNFIAELMTYLIFTKKRTKKTFILAESESRLLSVYWNLKRIDTEPYLLERILSVIEDRTFIVRHSIEIVQNNVMLVKGFPKLPKIR